MARPGGLKRALAAGLVGAALPLLSGAVPASIGLAYADDGPSFDAIANAYGVDATISNPSLPLGLTIEGAGPTAQAHLDNLGDSDAFASFPYPGDTVAGLPGVAGALLGNLPTPAYPMIVTTQAGDRAKSAGLPGISLSAESQNSVAAAKSVVGSEALGFTSTARVQVLADKSVQAESETVFGANLLGLIKISGINSTAKVVADATTGKLTRESHLSIGEISIPALHVALPSTTPTMIPIPIPIPGLPQLPPINLPPLPIPLGGTTLVEPNIGFEDGTFTVTLPLPILDKGIKFAIPAQPVLDAFKALGVTITYQKAQETSTGVVAPVLTFDFTVAAPPSNAVFNGPTPVSFALGRSTANITLNPVVSTFGGDTPGSTGVAPPPVTTPAGGTGGGAGTGSSGVLPVTAGSNPVLPTLPGSLPPPGTGASSAAAPAAQPASAGPSPATVRASADIAQADLSGIYLMCVAIAGAALVAGSITRLLGVRLLWGL